MRLKLKYHNDAIDIVSKPFAGGGEGNLYEIRFPSRWRDYVAKIYHTTKLTPERERKIIFLSQHPPSISTDEYRHPSVVWVTDVLYDAHGKFVGFIMPRIMGAKLEILCTPKIPRKVLHEWSRFDFNSAANALQMRMKLSFNLCAAIHQIHDAEKYVLVDMKPDNIIIQPNGLVSIVDTDSVEVVDAGKSIFDAPVATPEYTPPEHYQKLNIDPTTQQEWDLFGLGVILYKLLFGIHPFAASARAPYDNLVSLDDKIKHGLFVYHPEKQQQFTTIPPPHKQFYRIHPTLQQLFIRCFVDGHYNPAMRPSAEEWCATLLYVMDDQVALQRYGHILGIGSSQVNKPHFNLPSNVTALPYQNTTLSKMMKYAGPLKLPQPRSPKLSDAFMYEFDFKSPELIHYVMGIVAFAVASGVTGGFLMPLVGALFLIYGNYAGNKRYQEKTKKQEKYNKEKARYQKQQKKLTNAHNSYKGAIKKIATKLQKIAGEIDKEIAGLKVFLKQKDKEVLAIQEEVDQYYNQLNQKYLELALNDRFIARVGDKDKHNSISKIRIELNKNYEEQVKQISGKIRIDDSHPKFQEGKIAVDKIVKRSKIKIEEDSEEKIQEILNAPNEKLEAEKESLLYAADINSHLSRLWNGRWFVSINQKKRMKQGFEKAGIHSIRQIQKVELNKKSILLRSGKTIQLKELIGTNKATAQNLLYWHNEVKNLEELYQRKKETREKKLKVKIKAVENEKKIEIRNLKQLEREELDKVKVSVQKVVLGEPFVQLNQQHQQMTAYLEELEVAYAEEQDLNTTQYEEQYKAILAEAEAAVVMVKEKISVLEQQMKQYDKRLYSDRVQSKYNEVEIQLDHLHKLLPRLEQRARDLEKYKKITFEHYSKKLFAKFLK